MLRVLDYYKLDRSAEKRLLDEVAGTLAGLSKEQMAEVIARLEKAAKVNNDKKAQPEVDAAYDRHREVLDRLRQLLKRYEAVKNLEQAAERLDRASKAETGLQLQSSKLLQQWRAQQEGQKRNIERRSQRALMSEVQHQADEQSDLQKEVARTLQQMTGLKDQLPPEQKERVQQAEAMAGEQHVLDTLAKAAERLQGRGRTEPRELLWQSATELQRKAAADLQELARALRAPPDKLAALREARERIDKALEKQELLRDDAQAQRDPRVQDREKLEQKDGVARHAQEQAEQQEHVREQTRSTQSFLKPHAPQVASKLTPAEKAMQQAREALQKKNPLDAVEPEAEAAERLEGVRKDLDRMIAEAEKQQTDPLAALQNAARTVDRLLKEQKDTRDKTQEAQAQAHAERMTPLARKQEDLAKRTEDLQQQPMPAKPQTQEALDKAARAMESAGKALQEKKGNDAVPEQDQAIKSLAEAKKQLGEQMAEVQKRRDEIGKLEAASKKLAELARKEGKVGEQAQDLAQQKKSEGSQDLARQQAELTPQAKDVGKQLEDAVPKAAEQVAKGAEHMDAAKGNLEKQQPKPAAKQAVEAAKKLQEAQQAIAKALDEQRGQEIAYQAAMEQDRVNPANAAQQIAKAIQQAKQAARQSQKAAEQMRSDPKKQNSDQPSLAKLQQQVADKAADMKFHQASKPAAGAARHLENGELDAAIEQQKQALAQLEKDAEASQSRAQQGKAADQEAEAKSAKSQGQGSGQGKPMSQGSAGKTPTSAPQGKKNASELASKQKALLSATEALAKSQDANQGAMAALEQAQAQAPSAVQPQLQAAGQQLGQAGQQLNQGTPTPANQAQQHAIGNLNKAMQMLDAALAAMGQQPGSQAGKPQQMARAEQPQPGPGQQPGQTPGKQPGRGQNKSGQRGQSEERNQGKGTGNREVSAALKNAPSQMKDVRGDGSFIHLPPRQREMIRQALSAKLPPEYAALIQQYYVNIARGKPATTEKR